VWVSWPGANPQQHTVCATCALYHLHPLSLVGSLSAVKALSHVTVANKPAAVTVVMCVCVQVGLLEEWRQKGDNFEGSDTESCTGSSCSSRAPSSRWSDHGCSWRDCVDDADFYSD
jgi:hypothetical protein